MIMTSYSIHMMKATAAPGYMLHSMPSKTCTYMPNSKLKADQLLSRNPTLQEPRLAPIHKE